MASTSNPEAARACALVVIGGGASMPHHGDGRVDHAAHERLLASLPQAARVLAWHGVEDAMRERIRGASPGCVLDVFGDTEALAAVAPPYDLIVLDRGIETFDDAPALLQALRARAHAHTTLALVHRPHTSLAMLQRWVEADLTDSDDGPLAMRGLRHRSLASLTKLLMDSGWMPTLADASYAPPRDDAFARGALALAATLRIPPTTAQRHWRLQRGIVHAKPVFAVLPEAAPPRANFAVVVPTTNDAQLRVNVECSPGLTEVGARVISVRRAADPADALARALEHVHEDWVLLCHQDVYFARSFGAQLAALLDGIDPAQRSRTLIGFAGIGVNAATHAYEHAGFVIDRTSRFDNAASDAALSIDELALVLPRDSLLRIDPALGWHLWATDLCLQAICSHQVFPRIVRMPLFHNSHSDHQLPAAFHVSAATLAAKYPDFGAIHTLCGVIDDRFLAQNRSEAA